MKLNVMFTIAAIVLFILSLLAVLALFMPAMFGPADAQMTFNILIAVVGWVSLGLIAWMVRNAEASKTCDALVMGYTFLFVVWAVISLVGQFGQFASLPGHQASWVIALFQALVAVGFIMAGMSSMSSTASKPSAAGSSSRSKRKKR